MTRLRLFPLWLVSGVLIFLAAGMGWQVLAQSTTESVWETPANVSQSGSAVQPAVAITDDGEVVVVWQDPFVGFQMVTGDGRTWSQPLAVPLPAVAPPPPGPAGANVGFNGFTPTLLIDGRDVVHAFWLDDQNALFYSQTPLADITVTWSTPQQIAESAAALSITTDGNDALHIGYIRPMDTTELPAGVYYRQSVDGGATWEDAQVLFTSPYLRGIARTQANITLTAVDENVYLAWDNQLLDIVFFSFSHDGGQTWAEPVVQDQRQVDDATGAPGPGLITVAAFGRQVHLVWRAAHGDTRCTNYHQFSPDNGRTWSAPQILFPDARECPLQNWLFVGQDNILFILTQFSTESYLQAWGGSQWSDPQIQAEFSTFPDPALFRTVQVTCVHPLVTPVGELLAVVCGLSQGNDVWALIRPLGGQAAWADVFGPPPIWTTPEQVGSSAFQLQSLQVVAAGDNRLHAFWNDSDQPVSPTGLLPDTTGAGTAIYYSRLDNGRWAAPRAILSSPIGKTSNPVAAAGLDGLLYVAWSGGLSGGIYFTQAVADLAASVTEWQEPELLPSPVNNQGAWPDMVLDAAGTIYLSYAIPLNENRGIYLVQSSHRSDTWSNPVAIFDAEAAGWEMVGPPALTLTGNNYLHALWSQQTLPGGVGALALYDAHSADGGRTWSEPTLVVDGDVVWSDQVGVGERTLHQVWLMRNQGVTLWHRVSFDNGLSWSEAERIVDPTTRSGPTTLLLDTVGELHLFALGQKTAGALVIQEWLWRDGNWQMANEINLDDDTLRTDAITAVTAPDNQIGLIFAQLMSDPTTDELIQSTYYLARQWDAPAVMPTPLPTMTPTPTPLPTLTPTPEPSATPMPTFNTTVGENTGLSIGPFNASDTVGGVVISVIPVVLLVAVVLIIGIRLTRRR